MDAYLELLAEECEVTEVARGHRAVFRGQGGCFQVTGGPNNWTREMAIKAAIFFWVLKQREQDEEL